MKKFVAVAVVLAFVAGGAFAISFSGDVMGQINVMEGSSADGDDDVVTGGSMVRARLTIEAANADDTFGALVRFQASGFGAPNAGVGTHTALGWWQPIPMFWLGIGFDNNGLFDAQGNSRWMFYREASDMTTNPGNAWGWGYSLQGQLGWNVWDFGHAFYVGYTAPGLAMSIRPIPELSINIGLPFIAGAVVQPAIPDGPLPEDPWWGGGSDAVSSNEIGDVFSAINLQARFNQAWGSVALTYRGSAEEYSPGSIFAYLNLRMIDNLDLDVGFGFHIRGEDHPEDTHIGIGLAAQYNINPDFGIRTRFMFGLDTADYYNFNVVMFDVLPFFTLGGNITIFCSVGITVDMFGGNGDSESALNWHLNPWVEIGGEWMPRFFAGFRLWSTNFPGDNGDANFINWAVPIGLVINF